MKRLFTLLLTLVMCIVLFTGCCKTITKEHVEVTGTVTQMQYKASYTTLIPIFNAATKTTTLIPQVHPAQHLVTITYGGISETFDNQTLYTTLKEGSNIQVILCKQYDSDNTLIKETLHLIEETEEKE